MDSRRHRNWCFTAWVQPEWCPKYMRYLIFQKEIAPSTKKLHFQGYVEFKEGYTMKKIKEIFNDEKIHLEPRKGSQQQAIDYCKKINSSIKDSLEEYGESKNQGARSDLTSIWEAIESGATKIELLREYQGNALRHLGMIDRAQKAVWGMDPMDTFITRCRKEEEKLLKAADSAFLEGKICGYHHIDDIPTHRKNTEVTGNTTPSLPDEEWDGS